MICATLSLRKHAATAGVAPDPHPAATAKAVPKDSAVDKGDGSKVTLWKIACWKSPFASGEITLDSVSSDPADWPPTVTLFRSPPNAAMLLCTHLSANCWSRRP